MPQGLTVFEFASGCAGLLVLIGALGVAAVVLRRRLTQVAGPAAVLVDLALGVSMLVSLAVLAGVIGVLGPGATLGGALVLVAAVVAWNRQRPPRTVSHTATAGSGASQSTPVVKVAVALLVSLVVASWIRRTLLALEYGIGGVDSLWFHLPLASNFLQSGTILDPVYTDVEFVVAPFYPSNSELLGAVWAGFLGGHEIVTAVVGVVWLGVALFAAWRVGCSRGAGPLSVLATLPVLGAPMLVASQAGEAKNDLMAIALLLVAIALVVEFRADRRLLVLAGFVAGIAAGTKLTVLAPVASLWIGVVALADRGERQRVALTWFAAAVAGGGIWYLRNLIHTGNPLPWLALGPLPAPAGGEYATTDAAVFEYLGDWQVVKEYFLPALGQEMGALWPLTLGLAALGLGLAAAAKGDRELRRLAFVGIASLGAYLVTPFSAGGPDGEPVGFALNVRYAAPALLVGLLLLPLRLATASRFVILALVAAFGLATMAAQFEGGVWASEFAARAVLGVLIAGSLVVAIGFAWRRRLARPVLASAVALGVALAALASYRLADRYVDYAYGAVGPTSTWRVFGLTDLYIWGRAQRDTRIALGGTIGSFFQHPFYGRDLSNKVQRIGRRGPNGAFLPVADCAEWRRLVNEGRYEYVVATPRLDIWHPHSPAPSPERRWTATDPAAVPLIETPNGAIFRLDGEMSAERCAGRG